MYPALVVADYIIQYGSIKRIGISNLKLQKLLYFVQAEFLVERNEPCFPEEIEAWDFGPVVPKVYRKYKIYGSSNIPCIRRHNDGYIAPKDKKIISEMVEEAGKYSASQLVDITHHQTPWIAAYSHYSNNVISTNSIKKYFTTV